jgi:predicted glycoside hydrolase/deacetylase ChbG (UPF0249 family)
VVLVDGEPVLSPTRDVPNLADPLDGRFRPTLFSFLKWLYLGSGCRGPNPLAPREIEAEAAAQIALLQSRGLRLTHIDTHKHTHMFPAVLRPVLRAARAAGIRAVRNPFEPVWSLRATAGARWVRRTEVRLLRLLEPAFHRIVAEEGFTTTGGALGVLATSSLTAATVSSLLQRLPVGDFELVAHPGYNDADLALANTRLLSSRETEIAALDGLRQFPALELISFANLLPPPESVTSL